MNHLYRELAPVSERAWQQIDREAERVLRHFLAGRKLVDFSGPHGWDHGALQLGRVDPAADPPADRVTADVRRVQPLVELRAPFEVARVEIDSIDRGNDAPDLGPVGDAARRAALAEDRSVFHGYAAGGIEGIAQATTHDRLPISDDYNEYPGTVARAVALLQRAGIGGPYGIALGPKCHTGVIETTERGGYPVLEHIRLILGGPVVWAPGVDGAIVLSLRGGDFQLVSGQDLSIGYLDHDAESVRMALVESLAFRVLEPDAAVWLAYTS
ncbi:MAG TPA: family 1 encapsulin nanocompartment shell protein [Acidimicrobiia bacterium]